MTENLKNKNIMGWALYDWANSSFALAITTAIFPNYYNQVSNEISKEGIVYFLGYQFSSVSLFSYSISFSYLIIALSSPILGAVADTKNNKKLFMLIFSLIGSLSCFLLYFFDKNNFDIGILSFIMGLIAFSGGNVFNDAMITDITTKENYAKISSIGFISGYLGSLIHLVICLFLIIGYKELGFENQIQPVKISFILVSLWWIIFSLISFCLITNPDNYNNRVEKINLVTSSFNIVYSSLVFIKSNRLLQIFLISTFFYNMGVQTSLYMSTVYAAKEIKMSGDELIIVVLIIQIVAILGTFLITKLKKNANFSTILVLGSIFWIFLCLYAYIIKTSLQFYFLALGVGFIMGGVQSLARGAFSNLISNNKNLSTTLFSFYSITDKLSIFIGLMIYGKVNSLTNNMRLSIFSIILYFLLALISSFLLKKYSEKYNKVI